MKVARFAGWLLLAASCKDVSASPPPVAATTASPTPPPISTVTPTATSAATAAPPPAASVCPAGEVPIPATGADGFVMGTVTPPRRVVLTKPFCIDADEVTVKAYRECVDAK